MAGKNTRDVRNRNWVFIVYPESAPENWREILDEQHVPWIESPLHDMDTNPGTGEVKKAHWHVAMIFHGKKSFEQVQEITASVNSPIPQPIQDMRGQIRYFAHLDNPDKAQYSIDAIIPHSGADLDSYLGPTSGEVTAMLAAMTVYVSENGIVEFSDLVDYARENEPSWFKLLSERSTLFMKEYIKSKNFAARCGSNS